MTVFQNPVADPLGTRRGPPLVRGPQFETAALNHLHRDSCEMAIDSFVRCTGLLRCSTKCRGTFYRCELTSVSITRPQALQDRQPTWLPHIHNSH